MDSRDLARAPRSLQTARLRLEAPRIEHARPFVDGLNASLPDLRFIAWGQQARDLAWAREFVDWERAWVDRGEGLAYHAFESGDDAYVGRVDLHSWDYEAPRCEVGYVGDSRRAGRGLMREAVLAVVAVGFGLGLARIQALSEADNVRALHFAEHALGFTREGVLRNYERDAQGRLGLQVMFAAYAADAS
jgi:RimJ/RimL family protein N-acetyltransferase